MICWVVVFRGFEGCEVLGGNCCYGLVVFLVWCFEVFVLFVLVRYLILFWELKLVFDCFGFELWLWICGIDDVCWWRYCWIVWLMDFIIFWSSFFCCVIWFSVVVRFEILGLLLLVLSCLISDLSLLIWFFVFLCVKCCVFWLSLCFLSFWVVIWIVLGFCFLVVWCVELFMDINNGLGFCLKEEVKFRKYCGYMIEISGEDVVLGSCRMG